MFLHYTLTGDQAKEAVRIAQEKFDKHQPQVVVDRVEAGPWR